MKKVFFENARIIDGTGAPALEKGTLVMEVPKAENQQGKILYVGDPLKLPVKPEPGDDVVDLTGYSLIPGLFNCHVHLWSSSVKPMFHADHLGVPTRTLMYLRNTMEALSAGTTTMRTCGGSDDIDIALRDAINKGMVSGSRIITCGPPIEPHGGHCWITWGTITCSGEDEFVRAARTEMGKGVDQVKLMYSGGAGGTAAEGMFDSHITDEEAAAVCKVAHMRRHKVVAHLSNDTAIRSALRAGVDSVEHGYSMNEETAKMLVEKGAYYVPTLLVTGFPDWSGQKAPNAHWAAVYEKLRKAHIVHRQSVEYAIKHGAKICVGTDTLPATTGQGIFATMQEVILLTECGLTPLEAIKAGTMNSAELLEVGNITGHLEEGLYADLDIFKGEVDKNIHDLKNLSMVVKGGRVIWSEVEGYQKSRGQMGFSLDNGPTDSFSKYW